VHDYRERKILEALLVLIVRVVRFVCANSDCRATWQVLPAFMPRHLWWTWRTIEQETTTDSTEETDNSERGPSTRTRQRWLQRLRASAGQLLRLLMARAQHSVRAVVGKLGVEASRAQLVASLQGVMSVSSGRRYGTVAALIDDMERGVRLM
jgi:hypothetical protein